MSQAVPRERKLGEYFQFSSQTLFFFFFFLRKSFEELHQEQESTLFSLFFRFCFINMVGT
jgi:hypothetical protein